MAERLTELLAGWNWTGALLATLWAGLVAFTLGLSFLLWTRWGNYHLTGKCVLFSLLAHMLLGLFVSTAKVVDNVVVAFSETDDSLRPLDIENVRIVNTPDDLFRESERDGHGDDVGPIGVWDRASGGVQIDPAMLDRAAPGTPDAAAAQRTAIEAHPLPHQSPKPELPVQAAMPDAPKLARSDPEKTAERVGQLAEPAEPTAKSQGNQPENLPNEAPQRATPTMRTAQAIRTKDAAASGVTSGPSDVAKVRVPVTATVPGTVPETNVPARAVISAVRPGGRASGESDSPSTSLPISSPDVAGPSGTGGGTGRAASGTGSSILPSSKVRPGFSPGGGGGAGGDASAPVRAGSPGNSEVALPVARSGGTGLAATPSGSGSTASPGPSSPIRAFGSGGQGATDREGMPLGTPEIYRERMNPNRSEQAITRGGSKESEEAVERALAWLAAHQHKDGHWDADGFTMHCPPGDLCVGTGSQNRDDCAVTGLVLLAFLGAGHTHQSGKYDVQVVNGLNWLVAQQKSSGDLRGTGRMYSQGIATLALSEAFGMTGDAKLRDPVERAVKFIVNAQNPSSGGWRYLPGQFGDTSILGWQVMALKSASIADVPVPDATWIKARNWLTTVGSGPSRGLASYLPGEQPTPTMTAEALACRLFMGSTADDPAVRAAADYLMDYLPQPGRQNLYYWYYGTVASFQIGGTHWQRWNASLRDQLIARQVRDNHAAGSWDPAGDPWGIEGGRVYTTALATLCLEVYYRFLPLQSLSATEPRRPVPAAAKRPERP